MKKKNTYGEVLTKIYPNPYNFIWLAIDIACLLVVVLFYKEMFEDRIKQIITLCIGVAWFGYLVAKKIYAVAHYLFLYEHGFELFTLFGKKSYRYDECEFSGEYIKSFSKIDVIMAFGGSGAGMRELHNLIIVAQAERCRLRISGLYFNHFEKEIQQFRIQRKMRELPGIPCPVTKTSRIHEDWDE